MGKTPTEKNTNSSQTLKRENHTDLVTANINVGAEVTQLFIGLAFTNNSKTEAVYLAKHKGASNEQMKSKFLKVFLEGQPIRYIGKLVKIKPTADQFIPLPPLETLTFKIRIDQLFDFQEGTHQYDIRYRAYHSHPDMSSGDAVEAKTVSFQYTK